MSSHSPLLLYKHRYLGWVELRVLPTGFRVTWSQTRRHTYTHLCVCLSVCLSVLHVVWVMTRLKYTVKLSQFRYICTVFTDWFRNVTFLMFTIEFFYSAYFTQRTHTHTLTHTHTHTHTHSYTLIHVHILAVYRRPHRSSSKYNPSWSRD